MQPNAGDDCIDNNDLLQLKSKQEPEGKLGGKKVIIVTIISNPSRCIYIY
jgi:hypothetical protein